MALCKTFPGRLPSELILDHYKILDPDVAASITPDMRFKLDIDALSYYNTEQEENRKRKEGALKEESEHPGMQRYTDSNSFWDEVAAANIDTAGGT